MTYLLCIGTLASFLCLLGEVSAETIEVSQWFDYFNERNWQGIEEMYADNAVIHGKKQVETGGNGVVSLGKAWVDVMPDLKLTPLHFSQEDEEVMVVHWRGEGTMKGERYDVVGTGKKKAFHGITCFKIGSNHIIEHWASVDYRALQRS